jgi:hypothetical protein
MKDKPQQQQPTTTTTTPVPLEAMPAEWGEMTRDAREWMEQLTKMNAKALDVLDPADVVSAAMGAVVALAGGHIPRPLLAKWLRDIADEMDAETARRARR